MSEMKIIYKDGRTEGIKLMNRFDNGEIRFISESGERYMMLCDGTFTKDGIVITSRMSENGKPVYSGRRALVVETAIQSISYPSNTEFEYTVGGFTGTVKLPIGASKEEIKRAIDFDIYKQLRKIPADQMIFGAYEVNQPPRM